MNSEWCFCDGDGGLEARAERAYSRRGLMALGMMGAVWWASSRSALAQATFRTPQAEGNVLVVVFLRGGADGLNVVTPYREDTYYNARPSLGIPAPQDRRYGEGRKLLDLDGFFGLNPALAPIYPLYQEGQLAALHAVGSGDESRSHFEAMAVMERGQYDQSSPEVSGWLARHLTVSPGSDSPLRAVAVSGVMPDSLSGATHAIALESLSDYRLNADAETKSMIRALYAEGRDPVSHSGRETLRVLDSLNRIDPGTYRPDHGATYDQSGVAEGLRQVAFLIKQDLGLEVAALDMGGYDTHVAQGQTEGWLSGLLGDLGRALAAFHRDLGAESRRVTVVVQTEFGRRLAENSGLGTDHGRGGVMFVLGAGVKGGKVYADWPGMSQDDVVFPGDLRVTTDYRDVLAEILANRLGNPAVERVFPGHRPRPIGIVA